MQLPQHQFTNTRPRSNKRLPSLPKSTLCTNKQKIKPRRMQQPRRLRKTTSRRPTKLSPHPPPKIYHTSNILPQRTNRPPHLSTTRQHNEKTKTICSNTTELTRQLYTKRQQRNRNKSTNHLLRPQTRPPINRPTHQCLTRDGQQHPHQYSPLQPLFPKYIKTNPSRHSNTNNKMGMWSHFVKRKRPLPFYLSPLLL